MKIPESIAWAIHDAGLDYFNCSYLQFYCEKEQREEASKCFLEAFDSVRTKAFHVCGKDEFCDMDQTIRTGWCTTTLTDDGFIATFGVLQDLNEVQWVHMSLNTGGTDPVETAIRAVLQRFPSICFQGVENYIYQDNWGGEDRYKEYSHGADVPSVNEILGKELSSALKERSFWDALKEQLKWSDEEDFIKVLNFFFAYSAYIQKDTLERLLMIAETEDPAIRAALEQELQENPIA